MAEPTPPTPSSPSPGNTAPEPPAAVTLESKFEELETGVEKRLRDVELEVAGRRSYEKVVIILGYAVIAAGIFLGFLGYRSMDDITRNFDERIDLRISALTQDRTATVASLRDRVESARQLIDELESTKDRWESEIGPVLGNLARYDPNTDLKGRYLAIRAARQSDPQWREKATDIVSRIVDHIDNAKEQKTVSSFDSSDIFNVAQLSRRLNRNDLEHKLVNAAFDASKTPSTRALYLQLQAQLQAQARGGRAEAFDELMQMVSRLTPENPQIVVAEGWNAAEALRRHTDLIEAIDRLIRRHDADQSVFLPSYAIWVKGRAHLRRGFPGDLQKAAEAFSDAVKRFQLEGLRTQWAHSLVGEFQEEFVSLLRSGVDTTELMATVADSGILDLNAILSKLIPSMPPSRGGGHGT